MHKKLIKKIIETGKKEDMEALEEIMFDLFKDIDDEAEYKHYEQKLYKLVYGHHLTEDVAKEWVDNMKNKDGSVGEHWTFTQTSQFAGNNNKADYYAVLNMMWSDYYNERHSTDDYVRMANDWFADKDASECKTVDYYIFVC